MILYQLRVSALEVGTLKSENPGVLPVRFTHDKVFRSSVAEHISCFWILAEYYEVRSTCRKISIKSAARDP